MIDGSEGFRPIADYGLLADCNAAALVDGDGSIGWLCLPRYDSPAVFAQILDPEGGYWLIKPTGACRSERRYLPGTLVIETTFATEFGTVKLIDAMAFAEGQRRHELGFGAPHLILRLVEGILGDVELSFELAPRPEYGLVKPLFRASERGGRTFGGPNQVVVSSGVRTAIEDSTMVATFKVSAGERVGFALQWSPPEGPAPESFSPDEVPARIADTVEAWRSWEAEHDIYRGPHRELVRVSSRVLKGLTYRPTGAIVAAPTTSLPETVGGERNWDYRYAWIRDASLTLEALYIGACSDEAEDFVSFMTSSAGGRASERSLQIMYGIAGEHDLTERELPHLRGWRDSRPVRVGNGAWGQTQLDVYGELLNSLYRVPRAARGPPRGDPAVRRRSCEYGCAPLARDGRRHVGDARRTAPSPFQQGAVLGGARPCDRARAAARDARRGRPLDGRARRDPRGCTHAGLERGTAGVRAVIRLRRS